MKNAYRPARGPTVSRQVVVSKNQIGTFGFATTVVALAKVGGSGAILPSMAMTSTGFTDVPAA